MYTNAKGLCLNRKKDKFKVIFSYKKLHKSRFKAIEKGRELERVLTETYLSDNYSTKTRYNSVLMMARDNNTSVKTIYKYLKKHGVTSNG